MKKLILAGLLLVSSNAQADQWCLYNWTLGTCENRTLTMAFCDQSEGQMGQAAATLCGFATTFKSLYDSASNSLNSCGSSLNQYASFYEECKADRFQIATQCNAVINQASTAVGQRDAVIVAQVNLIRKLRRACGSACRRIK